MPEHKPERRSGQQEKLPTVFGLKAIQPMDVMTKVGVRVGAAVMFALAVATFVNREFIEKHTQDHTLIGMVIDYTPFIVLVMLSMALFAHPEQTTQFFLRTLDKAVNLAADVIPFLRGLRKDRRSGA